MDIKECLRIMVEKKASDMFFRAKGNVRMRINGEVESITDIPNTVEEVNKAFDEILTQEQKEAFRKSPDLDFALFSEKLNQRFRVSIFMQRNTPSIVIRSIPASVGSMEELNLPSDVLKKLAMQTRGLVLLTGTMGSGKSTTIASTIEYMNEKTHRHILTLEEPIEYIFSDKNCIINQRELGRDVASYPVALRAFTLQSPDVIYIGNIRDYETMSAAITTAETGVLVLSTLHTVNAPRTVERIINFFPPHHHTLVRSQLASLLKGVISLRLVPTKDGTGRIPAYETMLLTPTISRLIREGKTWEMPQYIEDGSIFGMQSFNQSLVKLVKSGGISEEQAVKYSDNEDELILSLKGIRK